MPPPIENLQKRKIISSKFIFISRTRSWNAYRVIESAGSFPILNSMILHFHMLGLPMLVSKNVSICSIHNMFLSWFYAMVHDCYNDDHADRGTYLRHFVDCAKSFFLRKSVCTDYSFAITTYLSHVMSECHVRNIFYNLINMQIKYICWSMLWQLSKMKI